ncbi:HSD17B4 [Symbiodinium sp. CCMP2592]|nr:HSD17B4 [Symbiodinium sp. CCMP2592]
MKSQALFDAMSAAVKAKGPELVKMGGAVFQFVISDGGDAGKFVLDLKNGSGSAKAGEEGSAAGTSGHIVALQLIAFLRCLRNRGSLTFNQDCTITMADADFMAMAEGKLDGMQAFMGGKLKIKGNMMLAQKLQSILEAAK